MGGFGAIRTALAYPDRFGGAAGFSPALIQHKVAAMTPDTMDPIANYDYYRLVFGEPARLPGSDKDPEHLLQTLAAAGRQLPKLFFCVGTGDSLCEDNRHFRDFLTEQNIPFQYMEDPGIHDFRFVRAHLEPALRYLLEED